MGRGLLILHIDGVGHRFLTRAIAAGRMPHVARLIANEGYEPLEYRCGIPSTTPFCQAGILYGDNHEIPSYRWWDKQAGLLVAFGMGSSFKKVAHRYFQDHEPLTAGGAVIGACYPAGASDTFALAYREPAAGASHMRVLAPFFASPLRVAAWLRHGLWAVAATTASTLRARLSGHPAQRAYVLSDMLEEIFLHHVARYAVHKAMDRGLPVIYAGFYAYDETSHGFGPEDRYSKQMLGHVDRTIGELANSRSGHPGPIADYELVVLSDHGQDETIPFDRADGRTLGEFVAEFLPNFEVKEYKGKTYSPKGDPLDGHVALAYSGGLAHLYFTDISGRLNAGELDRRFPGLLEKVAGVDRVAFVLVEDGSQGTLVSAQGRQPLTGPGAAALLSRYDPETDLLVQQLARLNSYQRSGDMIIFGQVNDGLQINFEHQVGGHGAIGGDQVRPFLLVKREWAIDTTAVKGASDLYPILRDLRDRLRAGPVAPAGLDLVSGSRKT